MKLTQKQYSDWLGRASKTFSCSKKRAYRDQQEAEHAAMAFVHHASLSAYLCRHCGGWHFGHTPDPAMYGIEIVDETPSSATEHREAHALNMKFD